MSKRKLESSEDILTEARKKNKRITYISWNVWLLIFEQSDLSAVVVTLEYIKQEFNKDWFQRLLEHKFIWKKWFFRDFPHVIENVGEGFPFWISKTEKGFASPWARYYIITRIAMRTLIESTISLVFSRSEWFPMTVVPKLIGTNLIHVTLIPKPQFKDLFRDEWLEKREEKMPFEQFLEKYLRPREGGSMDPDFNGIDLTHKKWDNGDPYGVYLNSTLLNIEQTLISGFGEEWENWEHGHIRDVVNKKLTFLTIQDDPRDGVTLLWIIWYMKMKYWGFRPTDMHSLVLNYMVSHTDEIFNSFNTRRNVKITYPDTLKQYGRDGLYNKRDKLLIGHQFDDITSQSLCRYCMTPTEFECEDCKVSFCSEEHMNALGHSICPKK